MADQRAPLTPEAVLTAFKADVQDAVSFIDSDIGPSRALATRFYNAEPFGDEEEGRSQVIKPVVRDTVRATLPSLMRIFFGGQRVVEFSGSDLKRANEMTEAVEYVFRRQNPGWSISWDAFKDALVRKVGIVMWWWDDATHVSARVFDGCSLEQVANMEAALESYEQLEVISQTKVGEIPPVPATPDVIDPNTGEVLALGMPEQPGEEVFSYKIRIVCRKPKNQVRVASVPPEEFIINRDARSLDDARIVGHRCLKTRGELAAMGIDDELISRAGGDSGGLETNQEKIAREGQNVVRTGLTGETPDQKKILYVHAYYKVDADGDGITELRRIVTIGDNFIEVSNEYADEVQMATMCPDPEPHMVFGLSQADNVMDLQLIGSHVTRDMLDSLKSSIFPRTVYVEGQANADDVLNTEIGAAIRARNIEAVKVLTTPFLGQQAMPVLDWLDGEREMRTGQSRNAMGIDPRALQSTNQIAVTQAVSAAQAQPELIARIFAETGMKRMFRGILKLLVENHQGSMQVPIRGAFQDLDPSKWDVDAEVIVDTGLGVGSSDQKIAVLSGIASAQAEALQLLGLENPLVSMQEFYHTQEMILRLSGFRDVHRFWRNPEEMADQLEEKQPEPTPEEVLANAQMEISAGELSVKQLETILKDDRERDKMELEAYLKALEIQAQYGTQLDTAALKAITDRQRTISQAAIAKARAITSAKKPAAKK